LGQTQVIHDEHVYIELWSSLASLLRSYTVAHGLDMNRQATVEADEEKITVRHGEKRLHLERNASIVTWMREDSSSGKMEITEAGRLRNETGEDEMDLIAEAWARELMR
jgi:cell division inhibitor SulA